MRASSKNKLLKLASVVWHRGVELSCEALELGYLGPHPLFDTGLIGALRNRWQKFFDSSADAACRANEAIESCWSMVVIRHAPPVVTDERAGATIGLSEDY
jgi:hypothetical protein